MSKILRTFAIALTIALTASAAAATADTTPITVDQLLQSDVIVAPGATATPDERSRLEDAAKTLATADDQGESFPTKFVIVPAPGAGVDLNEQAATLLKAGKVKLGDDAINDNFKLDAVILLAPRAIGIAANAFPTEIADELDKERPTLRSDRVTGTIAIATALAHLDAINALPGDTTTQTKKSRSPLLWISTAIILAFGAVGFIAARRTAMKNTHADADLAESDRERAEDDGAPPPEMRQ